MGMKSAGIWFSPNWKVTTCSIDSDKVYQYNFRLDDLTSSDGELVPIISDAVAHKGFTRIELNDLHQGVKGRTLGKIKDHLRSIYRCFLRDGSLILIFNGDKLSYEEPQILSSPKSWEINNELDNKSLEWKKLINFKFGNNMTVRGFAGILETGSLKNADLVYSDVTDLSLVQTMKNIARRGIWTIELLRISENIWGISLRWS